MPSIVNLSWLSPIFAQASERLNLGELAGGARQVRFDGTGGQRVMGTRAAALGGRLKIMAAREARSARALVADLRKPAVGPRRAVHLPIPLAKARF